MAPNAVIFCVIFSLFLLLADARLDPSSADIAVGNQKSKDSAETTTAFHVSLPLTSFRDDGDLSRQIAHSLRFPLNLHRHPPLSYHRQVTLRPIEVPYGDDMVGLSKAEDEVKKKKSKKMKKEKRDDDSDSDSDSDDDEDELKETQHKKMKKMKKMMKREGKKMKKEREGKGGILKWISGFLN